MQRVNGWTCGVRVAILCGVVGLIMSSGAYAGVQPPSADELVVEGKEALVSADVLTAHERFLEAVQQEPDHQEGNFYLAITRVLTWTARHQSGFAALGFTGPGPSALSLADLNPLRFTAVPPQLLMIPSPFAHGSDVQAALLSHDLFGEVQESQANLDRVHNGFISLLPFHNPFLGTLEIEIDDADVALARAAIHLSLAQIYALQVYDVNVETEPVLNDIVGQGRSFNLETFLSTYPNFLRLHDASYLADVKRELLDASEAYLQADALLRAETDDQTNDLVSLSRLSDQAQKAEMARRGIKQLRASLRGETDPIVTLNIHPNRFQDTVRINPNPPFDDPHDVRSLLPVFEGQKLVKGSWPDRTFHGVLPGPEEPPTVQTEWRWLETGNSSFGVLNGWRTIATIPSEVSAITVAGWRATRSGTLSGNPLEQGIVTLTDTSCRQTYGPWSVAARSCHTLTDLTHNWSLHESDPRSSVAISCPIRYVAASRQLQFQSVDYNADCAVAVFGLFGDGPPESFAFAIDPEQLKSVVQGQMVTNRVNIERVIGPSRPVTLEVPNLPAGATASWSPLSCTPNPRCEVVLTIQTSLTTPPGAVSVTVRGVSETWQDQSTFGLIVSQSEHPPTPPDGQGPVLTFFGLARADGSEYPANIPGVYSVRPNIAVRLIVEAKPGPSGSLPGTQLAVPTGAPDVQVIANHSLGILPEANPLDFSNLAALHQTAALLKVGKVTVNALGVSNYLRTGSRVQYAMTGYLRTNELGSRTLQVRVRDQVGQFGAVQTIQIRVENP